MPEARVVQRVAQLREALAFVERATVPAPTRALERIAGDALARMKSQLRAIVLLSTAPGIDGADVEVLARPLLETGITLGWVGEDEEKARRLELHRSHQTVTELKEFVEAVNGRPLSGHVERDGFLSLRKRAIDAGAWYARAYAMSYPRLSIATHGHVGAVNTFQPGLMATANALEDAISGTLAILVWASAVLRWPRPDVELTLQALTSPD